MMRIRFFPVVALALFVLLCGFLMTGLETQPYVGRVPASTEVTRNPWYAASRFLEQQGKQVERVLSAASLQPLPSTDTLLILDDNRSRFTEQLVKKLHLWVKQGGQLVVAARKPQRRIEPMQLTPQQGLDNDPLLFPLGILPLPTEWQFPETPPELQQYMSLGTDIERLLSDAMREDKNFQQWLDWRWCRSTYPTEYAEIHMSSANELRQAMLDLDFKLQHHKQLHYLDKNGEQTLTWPFPLQPSVQRTFGSRFGTSMMQLSLGAGTVTVLTDIHIWSNDQLHWLDHAWLLTQLTGSSKQVWFVQSVEMPPLILMIWRHAWPVCITLAVVILLLLWQKGHRVGPILNGQDREPDFLDSLDAQGRFLWRTRQADWLLDSMRSHLLQQMGLTGSEQQLTHQDLEKLALQTGLSPDEINQALQPFQQKNSFTNERQRFLHRVSVLRILLQYSSQHQLDK